jgi:hypothetical protein
MWLPQWMEICLPMLEAKAAANWMQQGLTVTGALELLLSFAD